MPNLLLPHVTAQGLLPPGDYPLTLQQLSQSMLVVGPHPVPPGWDRPGRLRLVNNLTVLVSQLRQVGRINLLLPLASVQATWEYIAPKGKTRPLLCRDYRVELF